MHQEIARRRVLAAPVARLATIDPDGRPHLVPIVFALDAETLYTAVDAKPKRSRRLRRIENARERPDVVVLVDHYAHDWTRLWWVRLRGRARVLDDGDEAARALRLLSEKYEQYRRERPGLPVLAVDLRDWRGWDAAGGAKPGRRADAADSRPPAERDTSCASSFEEVEAGTRLLNHPITGP